MGVHPPEQPLTPAFNLETGNLETGNLETGGVKFVIHAVGPIWRGGHGDKNAHGDNRQSEAELLASAYRSSLVLAVDAGCTSIAFPAISTGVYGYPLTEAAKVSLQTILIFLSDQPELLVKVVLYDKGTLNIFKRALTRINSESAA